MLIKINNSNIYVENWGYGYYSYIISILDCVIKNNDLSINFILDCYDYDFGNNNKTLIIHINWEHTLVKKGG